jgi:arsenite methyltransferase
MPDAPKQDMAAYSGCVGGAALVTDLHRMLVTAGFERVRVTPKAESASFIREWFPGSGFEDCVASAIIEAVKPE